ncbi:MAG TPA: potassium transporter TrkA [Nitrosopumilaceae archaeon]|nr:potassium transporter TrkA [Nitrosopumilaceae archaeon]
MTTNQTPTKKTDSEILNGKKIEGFVQTGKVSGQTCSVCNERMELEEGDTICGNKWYHKECWNLMNKLDQKIATNHSHSENNAAKKFLIIGLGQIGYSNAEYMTSLGLKIDGYDISEKAIQRALENKVIQNKATSFEGYDYYIICISTHRPENMFLPYLDGLYEIAHQLAEKGKTGALVGIDSTIPRGTSEKVKEILGHRLHVVHVPHRFYVHEKKEHGVRQTRVLGACDPCCEKEAKNLYDDILHIPLYVVSSVNVAELTKIVENSYRFLEIAFAEELKMICDYSDIDFEELRKAVNTKWNIKILEAKEGIGGHCLPKDSQMFLDFSNDLLVTSLIKAAKMIDQQYRFHLIQKVIPEMPVAT